MNKHEMIRWVGAALAVVGGVTMTSDALACGGCFSPPPMTMGGGGANTVQTVTDHRMVLSVSSTQTTLWDQFSYSGNPSEFAWILPIRSGPDVRVELASDEFMTRVDELGRVTVEAPRVATRRCGQCVPASGFPQCASRGAPSFAGGRDAAVQAFDASSGFGDSGVTVIREQVVGPYQVATLRGTDAGSLRAWLTSNSFAIPASIEPTLMHYINLSMDFVAVRLRGGEGLRRMAPLRVTMPGSQPVLPLRMVAAGISDKVGLLLTVIAESRMEAQNFANFTIGDGDLTWDFLTDNDAVSAFRATVNRRARALGAAWQTESALSFGRLNFQQRTSVMTPIPRFDDDAGADAGAPAPAQSDAEVALSGIRANEIVVTRLRAELSGPQLDRDLQLSASAGGLVANNVRFGVVRNATTPALCAPLACAPTDGRFETDGTIYGPYSERLAPSTVFPAEYRVGSLPDHAPVERTVPPVSCGPTAQPPAQPVRCSVSAPGAGRLGAFVGLFAALSAVTAVRRSRASRRAR
jgi:hypothetical protein